MASLTSYPFRFLIFFACSLLISTSGNGQLCYPKNHVALFIFGDSLFDVGNNNYVKNAGQANFWPYGETFFKYPTGRYSDGRIIPDFIAEYLNLPFLSPYLHPGNKYHTNGVNFASGGAGALVETFQGKVIDLKTQVSYFKNVEKQLRQKLGDKETKALVSRAIYIISIGSNDYGARFTTNSTVLQHYSSEEFVGMVIGNLTIVLKEIYKIGGRKFGLGNMAPLGCLPSMRAINKQMHNSGGCIEEVTTLAKLHNRALPEVLKELKRELKGSKYSIFDTYTSLYDRFLNPEKFGFKEGKMGCCGSGPYRGIASCGGKGAIKEYELCEDPSDYMFFDSGHPSDKLHSQLAELMWSGSPNVTSPYNLKELSEG